MTEAQQQHRSMPIIGQGRIPSWSQGPEEEDEEECDSVSWTEQTEGLFQQKLINIDEEMGTDDLQVLKFLCLDYIAASKLESATSPIDIFVHMKKALLFDVNNTDFLLECLARLHRFDLIRKLGFDPDRVKAELPHMENVTKFRQLLLEMAEEMDDKDLQKLKFFLNGQIKKKKLSDTKSILDMFIIMEQEEIVTSQKLDGLAEIMSSIGRRDLVTMVNRHIGYVPNRPQPQFSQIGNQSNGVGQTGLGINFQTGDRTVSEIAGPPAYRREIIQGSGSAGVPRPPIDRSPSAGTLSVSSSESSAIEEAGAGSCGDQDLMPEDLLRQIADGLKHQFNDLGIELGFTNDEIEEYNDRYQDPHEKTKAILKRWQSRKLDKKEIGPGILYAVSKLGQKGPAATIKSWMESRYHGNQAPSTRESVAQPRRTTEPFYFVNTQQGNAIDIVTNTNAAQPNQPVGGPNVNSALPPAPQALNGQNSNIEEHRNNYSSLREARPFRWVDHFDAQTQETNLTQIEALFRNVNISAAAAGQPEQLINRFGQVLPPQVANSGEIRMPVLPQPAIQNGVNQWPGITQPVMDQAVPQPATSNPRVPAQMINPTPVLPQPAPAGNRDIPIQQVPPTVAQNQPSANQNAGSSLPEYKMDRKPRGWCVIINNKEFYVERGADDAKDMPPRVGTDKDAESIQHVFEKLGFTVQRKDNLKDTQMMQFLIDVAYNVDHSRFDCLVVCILTHGVENHVYGSNGKLVSIKDITSTFQANRCPQLAGKPKLFFLQACQGRNKMEANEIEKDALPSDRRGSAGRNRNADDRKNALETDNDNKEMIPNEADFLIGYATVPGFVSFRSRNHGSWYIRKLCELLEKHCDRDDLLSILVEVNREVCRANAHIDGGVFKQTPAPLVTLRKKLYFR